MRRLLNVVFALIVFSLFALGLPSIGSGTAVAAPGGKVGICHRTNSASHPLQFIEVSTNALQAHLDHGDIAPAADQAFCDIVLTPTPTPTNTPEPTATPTPTNTPTPTPQPCNTQTLSGGEGVTSTQHNLGATAGTFNFTWENYTIPDQIDILYEGTTIFTTGGPVSGAGNVNVAFGPGTDTFVTVVVTGPSGTAWDYVVSCPTP